MFTYIYDLTPKLIETLVIDVEEFTKEPNSYFESWNSETMIATDVYIAYPILDNKQIREKTILEKLKLDNKLELLLPGEVFEDGVIKTIPKPTGVKIEWEYPNWIETATDLDTINAQYAEYEPLDRPSVLEEMGTELATEVKTMLIQLREMKYQITQASKSRRSRRSVSAVELPKPSESLIQFKDRFNMINKKGVM